MKAQGFRNWRNHACFEHAALNWNEWCRDNGVTFDEAKS